jgi:hypothetical protein
LRIAVKLPGEAFTQAAKLSLAAFRRAAVFEAIICADGLDVPENGR